MEKIKPIIVVYKDSEKYDLDKILDVYFFQKEISGGMKYNKNDIKDIFEDALNIGYTLSKFINEKPK